MKPARGFYGRRQPALFARIVDTLEMTARGAAVVAVLRKGINRGKRRKGA